MEAICLRCPNGNTLSQHWMTALAYPFLSAQIPGHKPGAPFEELPEVLRGPKLEIYRAVMAEVLAAQPAERPRILTDAAKANPDLSGVFNGLARLENVLLPGLGGSERSICNIVERAGELALAMKHATQQASPYSFKLILTLAESLALCTELDAYENAYDCEHPIAPHFCQVIETWAQSMENKLRERPEDLPTLRRAALEELLEWDILVVSDMENDEDEGSTENT